MVLTTDPKIVVGAALEGVNESLWTSNMPVTDVTGQMEFVISPKERGSEVLVGENARTSRIDLGMPWPPEARIDPDEPLQRIPVPLLWRSLVQDRTGNAEWVTATNSRKHADMLAAHILDRLHACEDASEYFIAIPDQLSDFSQQKLLDAFSRKGKRNVRFVWTPVALALSWLDKLGGALTLNSSDKDYVMVLHLGVGGLSCTKFLLREKKLDGETYVCPVRSGGGECIDVDVLDLVNMRIQGVLESIDSISQGDNLAASWFCLGIPEVWGATARRKGAHSKLFNLAGSWQLLPTSNLQEFLPVDSKLRPDLQIHDLLDSVYATSRADLKGTSWNELIDRLLTDQIDGLKGNLRGVIVGGLPFVEEDNDWSTYISEKLSKKVKGRVVASPSPDAIWNTLEASTAIAVGAGVYGIRRQSGLPTYFDVLPYLGVHAQEENPDDDEVDESFVALIPDGSEAEGGKPYIPQPIKKQFALAQGQNELEAILELEDQGRRTLRKTTFRFPHGPDRMMPLEVHVQVQTAGGLPTVEIIPEDAAFLDGIQVYLDWKSMEEIERDQLPKRALGWPGRRIPHIAIEKDYLHYGSYRALESTIEELLSTEFTDRSYPGRIVAFQQRIHGNISVGGSNTPRRIVDVDGTASNSKTQQLVDRLSRRLDADFKQTCELIESKRGNRRLLEKFEKRRDKLIIVGTWLFGAAPKSVREYLISLHAIDKKYPARCVPPAARVASSSEEITAYFRGMSNAAVERNNEPRWFLIYWLHGAKRILTSRSEAHLYLEREIVNDIYIGLMDDFREWVLEGGFGFGVTLQLLFYFLRYRKSHKTFLSKDGDSVDKNLHLELKKIIEEAKEYIGRRGRHLRGGRRRTAIEVLAGLEEFIDYKGSSNTLIKLREFDEDEGAR
jgi:hypothetical protein